MIARLVFKCLISCLAFSFLQADHDPFLIHSIPKCGTHFLHKTITTLIGKSILVKPVTPSNLDHAKQRDLILRSHDAFNPDMADMLDQENYKIIAIYRDPRDALISLVVYMRQYTGQGVRRDFFEVVPHFDLMSFDEQLMSVMLEKGRNRNYFDYYFSRINWHLLPFAYGVKYENLVGSKDGGDDQAQLQEILNIAAHIRYDITFEQAQETASKIYHSSGTVSIDGKDFVHGRVGSWKQFMKPKHKKLFKQNFGDLLIALEYEENSCW